jgi:hypothetical protein
MCGNKILREETGTHPQLSYPELRLIYDIPGDFILLNFALFHSEVCEMTQPTQAKASNLRYSAGTTNRKLSTAEVSSPKQEMALGYSCT